MNIQSEIADINTPTGIMRTYIHRPLDKAKPNKAYPTVLFYSEI
ncbi:MAG: hypothetical protein RLZZ434_1231, partial [Pseudomonadota bacterium]